MMPTDVAAKLDELLAQGWLRHDGGPCPVPPETLVGIMLFNGDSTHAFYRARMFQWKHSRPPHPFDIIAYLPEEMA